MSSTPNTDDTLLWDSPDSLFDTAVNLDWSTPLSDANMTGEGSSKSSPVDFAFEPPTLSTESTFDYKLEKTPNYATYAQNTFTNPSYSVPTYGYSSASSFSSTSGSATGSSFSSADALPAISRDFVRPSPIETRRPATAGGALQSRSPFGGYLGGDRERFQRYNQRSATVSVEESRPAEVVETIQEEGVFVNSNPFAASPNENEVEKQIQSPTPDASVDPRFIPTGPRINASQAQPTGPPNHWANTYTASPLTPYSYAASPAQAFQMGFVQPVSAHSHLQQLQMPMGSSSGRPQTSDGLPRYTGVGTIGVSLPSARTIVNQIDGFSPAPNFFAVRPEHKTMQPSSVMAFRDARAATTGNMQTTQATSRSYSMDSSKTARPTFVAPQGSESSEMNSQGELTFVPLGGPAPKKRPRRRFDEIERLYTCGWNGCEKAYGTLNHLNAHVAMQKHGEKRLPSEFKDMRKAWRKKKREQTNTEPDAQYIHGVTPWPNRGSIDSSMGSDFDRRNSVMSVMSSSDRGSAYVPHAYGEARPTTASSIASSVEGRSYFPGTQYSHHPLNAVPAAVRRPSAPGHVSLPTQIPQGFRQVDGDYPTPTPQNPYTAFARQGYPFQTLTSPMPMAAGGNQQFGAQFAFQH